MKSFVIATIALVSAAKTIRKEVGGDWEVTDEMISKIDQDIAETH